MTDTQTFAPPPGAPPPGPDVQPARDVTPNAGFAKRPSPLAPQSPFAQGAVPQPYQDESAAYARKAEADKAAWEKRQAQWTPIETKLRKELLAGNPPPPEQQRLPAPPSIDPQRYQQNALAFVGVMAVLGALAGKFTRNAGNASLNAFAGAVKGWQTGNLEAYEQKSKEWKQTTEQMLANNKMVLDKYRAVLENKSLNIEQQMMAAKLIAAEYQDKIAFDALDAGNYTMFAQLHDKQTAAQDKAVESFLKLSGDKYHETQQNQAKAQQLETPEGQAWIQGLDPANRLKIEGFLKVYGSGAPPLPSGGGGTGAGARNQIYADWKNQFTAEKGRPPTADEEKRFLQSMTTVRSAPAMALQKFIEEHPEASPEEIAQFAAHYSAKQKATRDFGSGTQGNAIRSFSVALDHLDVADQLGQALKNGDNQRINALRNTIKEQFEGWEGAVDFNFAKKIVGDEITKSILGSGAGTGQDREDIQKAFSSANSPQQLEGVIRTAKRLMAGQLRGLKQQYEQTTGQTDFDTRLSSAARRELGGLAPATASGDDGWGEVKVH
jgi:hypothetical protein